MLIYNAPLCRLYAERPTVSGKPVRAQNRELSNRVTRNLSVNNLKAISYEQGTG
jgi:hypothetical protein